MKEEAAIILTASAPEFGDLVPLMNFLLQVERMVFLPLKAASQMDHYQDSGTGPSEFHISLYADGLLTSLRCHQGSGAFQEGASRYHWIGSTRGVLCRTLEGAVDGCQSARRTTSTLPQSTNK